MQNNPTSDNLNTVRLALEALRTGNRFADNGRYLSANLFFNLSDRLAALSHEVPRLSPVRLYCEAVLGGMPEERADLFVTLCSMDVAMTYDLPKVERLETVPPVVAL